MKRKGILSECVVKPKAMVGGLWISEGWKFPRFCPVKGATVDHATTRYRAIARQEFSGRMDNQCRPHRDRITQIGRRSGVIDNEGQTCPLRHRRNGGYIRQIPLWVRNTFREDGTRIVVNGCFQGAKIFHINELGFPSKSLNRLGKLCDGPPI